MPLPPAFTLPISLYPAYAPLPRSMAQHLVLLEWRKRYRRVVPSKQPPAEQVWFSVLGRVARARQIVYEYMSPYVIADRQQQLKHERGFPSTEWLLQALETYGTRYAEPTVSYWQNKGLLRRTSARGPLTLSSVAAFLVARIADEDHERNWLPSSLMENEPSWWCYGQASAEASVRSIPIPVPLSSALTSATVLWTPWLGAIWEEQAWQPIEGHEIAARWWQSHLSLPDIEQWDTGLAQRLSHMLRENALLSQKTVQVAVLREASDTLLRQLAPTLGKKGDKNEPIRATLHHESELD